MAEIMIDGTPVIAPEGTTLLHAAHLADISIPTMCHREGIEPFGSCMICVVEDCDTGDLLPACNSPVDAHRRIVTDSPLIREARKANLELLLSEHLGDCEAPCRRGCPAFIHIPRMIRLLKDGRYREALLTVKRHIPFPSILGRICPAPCEAVCRRGRYDRPVAVCLLKRFVGDRGLEVRDVTVDRPTGKAEPAAVAVIGAGPPVFQPLITSFARDTGVLSMTIMWNPEAP